MRVCGGGRLKESEERLRAIAALQVDEAHHTHPPSLTHSLTLSLTHSLRFEGLQVDEAHHTPSLTDTDHVATQTQAQATSPHRHRHRHRAEELRAIAALQVAPPRVRGCLCVAACGCGCLCAWLLVRVAAFWLLARVGACPPAAGRLAGVGRPARLSRLGYIDFGFGDIDVRLGCIDA